MSLFLVFSAFWVFSLVLYGASLLYTPLGMIISYGKLQSSKGPDLMYPVSNRVGWCTFYVVGWCWNALLICFASGYMKAGLSSSLAYILGFPSSPVYVPLQFNVMMQVQLTRRLYETMFIQRFSDQRMHVVTFLAALSFYLFACSTVLVDVLSTSTVFGSTSSSIISCVMFLIGSVIQHQCHVILANLRTPNHNNGPPKPQYSVPHGNLFEYVSAPHYLAELCIYTSFLVLTQGKLVLVWLMYAFVIANLTHSALSTHSWYKKKFETYPPSRKALVPYLL